MNLHGIAAGGFFRAPTPSQRHLKSTVWKARGVTETNTGLPCSWEHVLSAAEQSSAKAAASSATTAGLPSAGKRGNCERRNSWKRNLKKIVKIKLLY